jgi:hypothetical protein
MIDDYHTKIIIDDYIIDYTISLMAMLYHTKIIIVINPIHLLEMTIHPYYIIDDYIIDDDL